MSKNFFSYKFALLALVSVSACSQSDLSEFEDMPADKIYNRGLDEYKKRNYKAASKAFQAYERLYPYSNWALNAQIMLGYTKYLTREYIDAIENFKIFIDLHPHHEKVPYCLYMIGLCYYNQLSIVQRDQSEAVDAIQYFEELVKRYPNSKYTQDAKKKIRELHDHLVGKEVDVARYYLRQGSYHSAIDRLKNLDKDFPEADHIPEVYFRLIEGYKGLGATDQAAKVSKVLQAKYPNSKWANYGKSVI